MSSENLEPQNDSQNEKWRTSYNAETRRTRPPPTLRYNRAVLVNVLVHHQHTNSSGCICGWAVLGASHPEHVATMYELALVYADD